jgi:hypothetical protein
LKRFYLASTFENLVGILESSRSMGRGFETIARGRYCGAAAVAIMLYGGVVMMVLVYKMWRPSRTAMPDDPGK